ncbi:hypothetical protein ENUP19_0004G0059 [Entamoeba nuttalli]|uniref:Glycerophosphocholine acyltransferase 1 n=1 Tax=Entamoeba nuttalli TaxID=412467 RepID=A0ABQ0D7J9_9EUKA
MSIISHRENEEIKEEMTSSVGKNNNEQSSQIKEEQPMAVDSNKIKIETIPVIDDSLKKRRNIKLLDKVTFVMSFGIALLTEYIMLRRAELIPILYLMLLIPLVIARFLVYRMSKWQFFLLDFCYYTNAGVITTLISIYCFNTVSPLFEIMFVNCAGPLLMAIILWTNSFVFHDLTKLTSIVIHFFPNLVLYYLRWKSSFPIPDHLTFLTGFVYPLIFYISWQVIYVIITEVIYKDKIYNGGYMTSLRWLCQIKPHMLHQFVTKKLGLFKDSPLNVMVWTQLAYTIITYIPVFLFYNYRWLHRTWMIFVLLWASYNGANFYLEIFTKKYDAYLQRFSPEKDRDTPK